MGCSTITKRNTICTRLNKRAVIEVQFNWIFILIAGAVILIFFASLVGKQKEFATASYATNVLTNMEAIMSGAGVALGSTQFIELADTRIDFSCDAYYVGEAQKNFKGKLTFAPSYLYGKYIVTWTQSFDVPFRATNFLYLTTPEIRYIIINDGNYAEKLYELLPQKEAEIDEEKKTMMNKEIVDNIAEIKDKNNYKVRIIFFENDNIGQITTLIRKTAADDLTALKITPSQETNILNSYGTVEFFKKRGNEFDKIGTSEYFTQSMLFGAVFTDDLETYNCLKNRAFEKMKMVADVYRERSGEIAGKYQEEAGAGTIPLCSAVHDSAAIKLTNINYDSLEGLYNLMNTLKNQNQDALRFSCAVIY